MDRIHWEIVLALGKVMNNCPISKRQYDLLMETPYSVIGKDRGGLISMWDIHRAVRWLRLRERRKPKSKEGTYGMVERKDPSS